MLDNFRNIEELFNLFTTNLLLTSDIKRQNAVLTSNNIVIIDPDLFKFSNKSISEISFLNKKKLLYFLKNIFFLETIKLELYKSKRENYNLIEKITDFKLDENTEVTFELSKKLKNVSKPIECFYK